MFNQIVINHMFIRKYFLKSDCKIIWKFMKMLQLTESCQFSFNLLSVKI